MHDTRPLRNRAEYEFTMLHGSTCSKLNFVNVRTLCATIFELRLHFVNYYYYYCIIIIIRNSLNFYADLYLYNKYSPFTRTRFHFHAQLNLHCIM